MDAARRRALFMRVLASVLVVIVLPLVLALQAFRDDETIRVSEPSPRTVITADLVRVIDEDATERARRDARDSVNPVTVFDDEAQATVIRRAQDVFAAVEEVRRPAPAPAPAATDPDGTVTETAQDREPVTPSREEQIEALRERIPFLDDAVLGALVDLSSSELDFLEPETVDIARELARQAITEEQLERVLNEQLRIELALRSFPDDSGSTVVDPLIRAVMQPTVQVDPAQTEAARDRAAAEVDDVVRTFPAGSPIVRAGEVVDEVQFAALEEVGFEGTDARRELAKAAGIVALLVLIAVAFLVVTQRIVWTNPALMLLLAVLTLGYGLFAAGISFLVESTQSGWWYVVPAGAFAMLATILVNPSVGALTVLPGVLLPVLLTPRTPGVAVFAAAAVLLSVPLVARIASRGDLRRASWQTMVTYPIIAVVTAAVFDPLGVIGTAAVAGFANGVLTSLIVNGTLPFFESIFRISTVTTLLDLADRNHPLLRELEHKALGSYNHSVMTATLVERACRTIGANALLGSVAALYHDIGKVRRPHFFIENQQGIPNPHDEIEPEVSAIIIQNHVVDGVEMARQYRLPPDVVAAIGAHHGTTLVKYFYNEAVQRAGEHGAEVDEAHFRYKGTKPRRKEAAVLFLADSCEATTRSMAMDRGTLSREEIEDTVDGLFDERIEDHQLVEADLTFAELQHVRDSIVEALVGIYHPRIAYPETSRRQRGQSKPQPPEAAAS
ncbi:MAG: HDIG domain-containing protein [Actinobacteria bacterium]|nr:HDIG domain-containing protein [Actinomycetota bacterium]